MVVGDGLQRPVPVPASADLGERLRQARLNAFLRVGRSQPTSSARDASGSHGPDDELARLLERTAGVYAAAITEQTRAHYVRRWHLFEIWCRAHGFVSLPAEAETVMLYLADATGGRGYALSTVRSWMAAINRVHLEAGFAPLSQHPAMGMFLRGLSRQVPRRSTPTRMSALRIDDLRAMCRALDAGTTDFRTLRDRALLCLHALGLSDGEISRLVWADVHMSERSLSVEVSKPRPGRRWKVVTAQARHPLGGSALGAMLALGAHTRGAADGGTRPVFTSVPTASRSGVEPLSHHGVFLVRKARLDSLSPSVERAEPALAIRLLEGGPSIVLRDKAMILIGFAGAFRRNEVTGLRWDDVEISKQGVILKLRRSKTDMAGRGCEVGIPRGRSELTCPVTALESWRARCALQFGQGLADPKHSDATTEDERHEAAAKVATALHGLPVFCQVGGSGRLRPIPLSPEGLTMVVRQRAGQAGIVGRWGGRSLRAGFISTAADLDIPLEAIARQSRHATLDSLVLYIREDDPFRRNPASRVGL